MAEGYRPQFIRYVDPFEDPVEFRLEKRRAELSASQEWMRGTVYGPEGEGVLGATVSPFGVRMGTSRRFGGLEDTDPVAVTAADGHFAFVYGGPVDGVFVQVSARGLAPVTLALATGDEQKEIRLGNGAAVSGRLLKDGEPVAGVRMGLLQENREASRAVDTFTIGTDDEGRFLFPNVTPDDRYFVYGQMDALRGIGAVPKRAVEVGGHDTEVDVGTLEVVRGHRITGRLLLPDDEPIPAGTRILVVTETTSDAQTAEVTADGRFEFRDVPAERVSIVPRMRGYRVSEANYSLDRINPFGLTGMVEADVEDLTMLLEPGPVEYRSPSQEAVRAHMERIDEPIRGISAHDEPEHLGGCILTSPIGEVPDDPYAVSDVVATDEYPPFTKKLVACGLTLVARDDASDAFLVQVGETIGEIFERADGLDLEKQAEILRNHYRYRALIPVPVGEDMGFLEDDEEAWDRLASRNSICDIIMEGVDGQVMEVVEHILHYVTDVGLHYAFPDEWGISPTSAVGLFMQEAIARGFYEVEQYEDIAREDPEAHFRVLVQEFAYWAISTAWDIQEAYGPGDEGEWRLTTAARLKSEMPALVLMIEETVGRTMVAPSRETLAGIGPTRAEERDR